MFRESVVFVAESKTQLFLVRVGSRPGLLLRSPRRMLVVVQRLTGPLTIGKKFSDAPFVVVCDGILKLCESLRQNRDRVSHIPVVSAQDGGPQIRVTAGHSCRVLESSGRELLI